jgi:phytoene synthase
MMREPEGDVGPRSQRRGTMIGPRSYGRPGDVEACQALLARGSKSFAAAATLLPRGTREPASALYAFCRLADDVVDLDNDADRVKRLRAKLARVYAGEGLDGPVDRALADVVRSFDLPRGVLGAMIDGFEWDAAGRRYATLSDTLAYAARVAGAVGAAMTVIMGSPQPHMVARACDLGLAMQLTNIARDVGEDARAGRLYLPLDRLAACGVDPEAFLRDPRPLPGVRRVVLELLEAADGLYARAEAGIAALRTDVRPAIYAARFIYADLGRIIRENGGDSVTSRAVVSTARKVALLGLALGHTWSSPGPLLHAPPAEEAAFLVRLVAGA